MGELTLDLIKDTLAHRERVTAAAEGLMPAAVMLLLYPKTASSASCSTSAP